MKAEEKLIKPHCDRNGHKYGRRDFYRFFEPAKTNGMRAVVTKYTQANYVLTTHAVTVSECVRASQPIRFAQKLTAVYQLN